MPGKYFTTEQHLLLRKAICTSSYLLRQFMGLRVTISTLIDDEETEAAGVKHLSLKTNISKYLSKQGSYLSSLYSGGRGRRIEEFEASLGYIISQNNLTTSVVNYIIFLVLFLFTCLFIVVLLGIKPRAS